MSTVLRYKPALSTLQRFQHQFLTWRPPEGTAFATTGVASAAYGTGKSSGGALRCGKHAVERPGGLTIVTAPISRTLETTLPNMLQGVIPPDFIRTRRKPHGNLEWVLQNGRRVVFWSGKGYIDSADADFVWCDEFHDRLYLDEVRWERLVGRLRGPAPYKELCVTGIAVEDEVLEERFYKPFEEGRPDFFLMFPGLKHAWVYRHDRAFVERSVRNKSKQLAHTMVHGGRVPPAQAAFPHLDLTLGGNVVDWDIEPWMEGSRKVVLSLDPGEQYGVVVGVKMKHPTEGHDIVVALQSWCLDRYSTDEVLQFIQEETDYRIGRVIVDTDSMRDTRRLVRQMLPDVPVEDIRKGSKGWKLQAKQDRFSWAIQAGEMDAKGNITHNGLRRFFVHKRMMREGKRGLVSLLRKAELQPNGLLTKPNDEHVRDAAIYMVCLLLKEKKATEVGTL